MLTRHRRATTVTVLLAAIAALLALASPAYAQLPVPDFGPPNPATPVAPTVQATSSGAPLWVFALVVLVTAVLTVGTVAATLQFKTAHRGGLSWIRQPHHS
ncbi:MAG TPA: hypothetical protein VGN18_09795 [Jatrophihabitans sp.]|jgi:hypothetical protein|uniref:hypothetical protein n=1 Tax=Jatrophihabitans sp. TaxID=1932789 RepID=UPI002E0A6759|nr:hypothetical protein [Jatrophihabitans sp.]